MHGYVRPAIDQYLQILKHLNKYPSDINYLELFLL